MPSVARLALIATAGHMITQFITQVTNPRRPIPREWSFILQDYSLGCLLLLLGVHIIVLSTNVPACLIAEAMACALMMNA